MNTPSQYQHFGARVASVRNEVGLEQEPTVLVLVPAAQHTVVLLAVALDGAARAREECESLLLQITLLRVFDDAHHPLVVVLVHFVNGVVQQRVVVVRQLH